MKHRLYKVSLIFLACAAVSLIILGAMRESIVFFVTPSDVLTTPTLRGKKILRLGGQVLKGSLEKKGIIITFQVTDGTNHIPVVYEGAVPDLFKEGQGVVALGNFLDTGTFMASQILAKHDENYMPKEVASKLKEQALWRG
jgi:cytochrome c-type biogenesis protein CcmE